LAELMGVHLARAGAPRVPPNAARIGDVGVTREGVACVRLPVGFVGRDATGALRVVAAVEAWAVGV